jgi:SMI1/KNR4 family protein SUKH-1
MATEIAQLRDELMAAETPGVMWRCVEQLLALAKGAENRAALEAIAAYVMSGSLAHLRSLVLGQMVTHIPEPDAAWAAFFQRNLAAPDLRYWSIVGYLRAAGADAYPELVALASDTGLPVADRACAIKQLAIHSHQSFDRRLPADPGQWREADLRLEELRAWVAKGFPEGEGYPTPIRDLALDQPVTHFEQMMARLDRILARERAARQDAANPSNWLAAVDPANIAVIMQRWSLPAQYLDFLTRFSPVDISVYSDLFINWLQLYGAHDLISGQRGYATDMSDQPLPDWPAHLLVIGRDGGDPYVLDLAQADEDDAPVYTAMEGSGEWRWSQVAPSFHEFIEQIVDSLASQDEDRA